MKLKDFKNEIKVLGIVALVNKAKALKIEINDLVLDKNMNKLKNLKAIFRKKKDIARILTVLAQKDLINKLESGNKDKELGEKTEELKLEKKGVTKK